MGYFGIPFRNGVPIGLGSVASFGAQQFDPSSLFIGGTAGTWYDPSDPTTLFTTSTGTTPCAVPGSGSQVLVGLMLDKSQGAPGALGAELVTNGDFPVNTTGWTAVNSPTLSVGANGVTIQNNGGTNGLIYQAITTVAGRMYKIEGTITYGGGFARIETNTTIPVTVGGNNINVNASGRYTWYFTAVASITYLVIGNRNDVNTANTYDNISVREIPGNHAIAFNDTTARPELSARVNLLTYSEQFENAAWATTAGVTFSENIATFSSTAYRYQSRTGLPTITGQTYIIRAKLSSSTGKATILLRMANGSSGADSVSQLVNLTATPTVYTLTRTFIAAGTAIDVGLDNRTALGGDGIAGDVVATEWDLRPANIGSAIPSYQRIADQYTYDSNGFPTYLRFDGVDDSMYTPASINFSGTDKMSVFAGVRKLSDAARGIVVESPVLGGFNVNAPGVVAAAYSVFSSGTVGVGPISSATNYAAPISNVLTFQSNIPAPSMTLRVNTIEVVNESSNQGTGNFNSSSLFIGSRANTSLFFNGHLYSLITAGTQLQSGSITATEQYVAGKTGVQI